MARLLEKLAVSKLMVARSFALYIIITSLNKRKVRPTPNFEAVPNPEYVLLFHIFERTVRCWYVASISFAFCDISIFCSGNVDKVGFGFHIFGLW